MQIYCYFVFNLVVTFFISCIKIPFLYIVVFTLHWHSTLSSTNQQIPLISLMFIALIFIQFIFHLGLDSHIDSIEAFLLSCPALALQRSQLNVTIDTFFHNNPELSTVKICFTDDPMQFLLDPSVLEQVIFSTQLFGPIVLSKLFKLTRNYCYLMHKTRINMLNIYCSPSQ